jgi:hypothetical protein
MRTYQRFTLPAHGAIEFLAGLTMMILPLALSFGPAALLVCVALGAILAGTSLGLTAQRPISSRAHSGFDNAFALVTALAALALAASGQPAPVILLAAVVLVQTTLGLTTRYVAPE